VGRHTLWAVNGRHLTFIRNFVAAGLRERVPNRNSRYASRMPAWIKKATKRDALLSALDHLSSLLLSPEGVRR
jgi:hypothetical protein